MEALADDLRSFLGINEVIVLLASQSAMADILAKCYQGKEESIVDLIGEIEANPKLNNKPDRDEHRPGRRRGNSRRRTCPQAH